MSDESFGDRLNDRRIVFVGGKGGVGKTTTASAFALRGAELGRRVLLVSTDPAHSLGDLFDVSLGDHPREIQSNLHGLEVDPEHEVDRYLEGVKATMRDFVQPAMYSEIERQIELARLSPGAAEAALLERVARLMHDAQDSYEQVIFDTAPTGHTLRLLALPEIMAAWMDGLLRSRDRSDAFGRALDRLGARKAAREDEEHAGQGEERTGQEDDPERPGDELSWFEGAEEAPSDPRRRRIRELLLERRRAFTRARRLLLDREMTAFVMVLIPEKLPILETQKALAVLQGHDVPVAGLVVNRVLPESPLGDFLESRRAQEAEYLDRIDRLFGQIPRVRVPLLRRDVEGRESLREIARYL